jgi:PTS system beta-glucosides-specific IIC component
VQRAARERGGRCWAGCGAYSELVEAAAGHATIASPLSGKVVPLADVPDPVFAAGATGAGIAIEPTDSRVYAPFDGIVAMVMPSKHAVGLRRRRGAAHPRGHRHRQAGG